MWLRSRWLHLRLVLYLTFVAVSRPWFETGRASNLVRRLISTGDHLHGRGAELLMSCSDGVA